MTVVPASFQLAGWIPAWWRATAGGDDLLELLDPSAVAALAELRGRVSLLTAYCPALGVSVLPGPRATTQSAVAAGEAVVLHGRDRGQSYLLIPDERGWDLVACDTPRPMNLERRQAAADMAEAVVVAEHSIREAGLQFSAAAVAVRPLPPDADSEQRGLLVRAARIWTAVDAVAPAQRTRELLRVLQTAALATLAAYTSADVNADERHPGRVGRFA